MKHPPFAKLLNKFEDSLSEIESQEIAEHLAACAECNMQAQKLSNFVNYAESAKFESVPQNITANLLNTFQPARKPVQEQESIVKRLFASLVFDDWQTALNERYVYSDNRQMLYKAGDFEIDLRLSFSGDKCQVSGQIFPECFEGTIEIAAAGLSESTGFNESCEFSLPPVANGVYELRLKIDDKLIAIQDFSLMP
jgi:hypothetical protein